MKERLRSATLVIAMLAIAGSFALLAKGGSYPSLPVLAVALGFGGWASTPYIAIALWARKPRASFAAVLVLFVVLLALAILGFWIYIDGFFFHADAQSGLLFIFVPMWQWAGLLPALVAALLLEARAARVKA